MIVPISTFITLQIQNDFAASTNKATHTSARLSARPCKSVFYIQPSHTDLLVCVYLVSINVQG